MSRGGSAQRRRERESFQSRPVVALARAPCFRRARQARGHGVLAAAHRRGTRRTPLAPVALCCGAQATAAAPRPRARVWRAARSRSRRRPSAHLALPPPSFLAPKHHQNHNHNRNVRQGVQGQGQVERQDRGAQEDAPRGETLCGARARLCRPRARALRKKKRGAAHSTSLLPTHTNNRWRRRACRRRPCARSPCSRC